MQKPSGNDRPANTGWTEWLRSKPGADRKLRQQLGVALLALYAFSVQAQKTDPLNFETVFSTKNEPANVHYKVEFSGQTGTHSLEVWRAGETRLRRKTDDAIDTYVIRDPKDHSEFQMTVVDYAKRTTTQIDRNNLIRLGQFNEWFDLAHGLRHPTGRYALRPTSAPDGVPTAIAACRWFVLQQATASPSSICWSEKDRLPLQIWVPQKGVVWRLTELDNKLAGKDIFTPQNEEFIRVDANADINDD